MTLISSILFLLLPLLFTTALAMLTTTHYSPTSWSTDLINKTCKNSSLGDPNIHYNFCIKALNSSSTSHHANLTSLGLISITLNKHNAINTRSLLKTLLKDEKVNKATKIGLRDCLELYSDSISTLREAARDYRAKRLDDANIKLSSVMDDSSTCEEGFEDVEVVSPLTKQNNFTFQLSAITLSIMDMLP